jgi:anti-repressor protein
MTLITNEGHSGQRGGPQSLAFVTEPGLYRLIGKSRKPEAREFSRWVYHEVLPSIRKKGTYSVPGASTWTVPSIEELVGNRSLVQNLLQVVGVFQEREESYLARIAEDTPLAEFARAIMEADIEVPIKTLATYVFQDGNKDIGEYRMFRTLKKDGWAYKDGKEWVPSQKALDQGLLVQREISWVDSKGRSGKYTRLFATPKGQVKFVWLYGRGKPVDRPAAIPLPWAGSLAAQLKLIK